MERFGSKRRDIALLSALALATPSLAEEARTSEERRPKLETDGESRETKNKDNPPRAQSLGKDQSGVFVNSSTSDSGYSPGFVMRGFPSSLTLFDGAAHGFTADDVNLAMVDHVEFYKGPSAMLFGKALGGYGGAANYIRKKPMGEGFTKATATLGSFGVRRLTFDIDTPSELSDNLLFRMTGFAQIRESFVDVQRSRGFDVAPAATLLLDNGDRLTLRSEYRAMRLVYRDGVPAAPIFLQVPREFYAGAPVNEHETPHAAEFSLTYEHAFDADWKLTTLVDYTLNGNEYGWFLGWGYDGNRSLTLGRPARSNFSTRNFDAQLRLSGRFDTGPIAHSVFLGLEHWDYFFGHNETVARDPLPPIDIGAPVYPLGVDFSNAFWSNGAARAWSQSAYAQDLIDLSPQWRILVGGRYDLLAQRETVHDPFGVIAGQPIHSLSEGITGYFSPRAGILYRPFADTQLFAAFGRSLIPNISVRLKSGSAPPPQQDTQYEIGLEHELTEWKASVGLGLFDVTRDHVAIVDPANPGGFYALVTGQQHSHGGEVNVSVEPLPGLKATAAATFLHAQVTKDSNTPSQVGSDLLGAPRRVYNFDLSYTFETGDLRGLSLGASFNYASRTEATQPNVQGFTLAPQQVLAASLGYRFDDHWSLDVSASNLTNRPNFTSGGALFYGEPRSVSATLTCKY
ncbi:TonB-dependent siderophore receptor [Methylosinus sp. Sm6]|uniref:TonB-dependent receptor n=1 Tax=Methylosinus sp. Sm6 TaxID=2866948 RepID=UPI0021055F5D|nr:TonB-dependent receptor [Methylosinus sp. Sm6]